MGCGQGVNAEAQACVLQKMAADDPKKGAALSAAVAEGKSKVKLKVDAATKVMTHTVVNNIFVKLHERRQWEAEGTMDASKLNTDSIKAIMEEFAQARAPSDRLSRAAAKLARPPESRNKPATSASVSITAKSRICTHIFTRQY